MTTNSFLASRPATFLALLAAVAFWPAGWGVAQSVTNFLDDTRSAFGAERQALVTEALQLTERERTAFLPVYQSYWAEREKLGDDLIKLVLEYADAYPNVTEPRAARLLKDYTELESKLAEQKTAQLRKAATALPATKALRYAQLESRMDLLLRRQLASAIPLLPIEGKLAGELATAAEMTAGKPGGAVVQTYELSATVTTIDSGSRKLTLMGADGIKETVRVTPDAINFDQIKVGDQLKVTVAQELVVAVVGSGEAVEDEAAGLVALAPVGAKPGGIVARTAQVTAKVTALNPAQHQATLQFEDGRTKTVAVRHDVDLARQKVGDQVIIRLTEALAIQVQQP